MSDLALTTFSLPTSPFNWSDGTPFDGYAVLVLTYDAENPPSRGTVPLPNKALFAIENGVLKYDAKMPLSTTYDAPVKHYCFYATAQREVLTGALPAGGFDILTDATTLPAPAAPLVKPVLPADPTGVTL